MAVTNKGVQTGPEAKIYDFWSCFCHVCFLVLDSVYVLCILSVKKDHLHIPNSQQIIEITVIIGKGQLFRETKGVKKELILIFGK